MVTENTPAVGETFIFRPRKFSGHKNRDGQLVTVVEAFTSGSGQPMRRIQFPGGVKYPVYLDELDRIVPAAPEEEPGQVRVYVTAWDRPIPGPYSQFDWALDRSPMADRFDALSEQIAAMQVELSASQGLYRRLLTGYVPDTENIGDYLLHHAGRRFSSRDGWELLALTGKLPGGMADPYPDNKPEPEVYAEHRFPDLAAYCVVVMDNEAGDEFIVKDNYAGAVNLYQKYMDEMHHGTVHLLALTPPLGEDCPNWLSIVETMAEQADAARDWSKWVHLSVFERTPKEYTAQLHEGTHPLYPKH